MAYEPNFVEQVKAVTKLFEAAAQTVDEDLDIGLILKEVNRYAVGLSKTLPDALQVSKPELDGISIEDFGPEDIEMLHIGAALVLVRFVLEIAKITQRPVSRREMTRLAANVTELLAVLADANRRARFEAERHTVRKSADPVKQAFS